ncbi:hypothetical protein C8D93_101692 [Sinimarinibacterium flocculans]|uniref:Uncharacterized protein n=1 Tax=Sinimarinibacterium flocculans TaxID=985250 RepID=A0A318EFT1_9GAMM|nr:hypothetical protein C8D93_101692 [Sinimarinibacterium flocculans]
MTVASESAGRFRRLLVFRRRGSPTQVLRVLEDTEGWHYVVRLAGTADFGPYVPAEITSAFDVEAEPCATHDLTSPSPESGQSGAIPE